MEMKFAFCRNSTRNGKESKWNDEIRSKVKEAENGSVFRFCLRTKKLIDCFKTL